MSRARRAPPFQMHPEDKALDHQMTLMEELRGSVEMNDDFEDDQDDLVVVVVLVVVVMMMMMILAWPQAKEKRRKIKKDKIQWSWTNH